MRIAIVENTRITHHGQVGVALNEAGALTDVFRPWDGSPLPAPANYDGLVVFGGEQSAVDDAAFPYLAALGARMRAFGAEGKPVFGICLGAQLLAREYGGRNVLGSAPEFGWCEVALTAEGKADPVLGAAPEAFRIFQWHSDTFTLPPGAVHLASGAGAAQQAFRVAPGVYGTQFHFEANRAVVADWSRLFPGMAEEMHPGWGGAHDRLAEEYGAAADRVGLALARAWVALVRAGGTAAAP